MTKNISKIGRLIDELCPYGVEFKKLGEVCEIADNKRRPVTSSLRVLGKIPYYGANNIQDHVEGFTHNGDFVLIAEEGSASLDNYSIQFATGKFWANNHVHVVRGLEGLNDRFLFHFLRNTNFRPFLTGGTRAKLTKGKMLEIKIPLPPLAIQEEIVEILNSFTELEAELETRKKQIEYYRNELLSIDDGVTRLPLEKICNFRNGYTPSKSKSEYWENGEIPWFRMEDIRENGKILDKSIQLVNKSAVKGKGVFPKDSIIVATSATIGEHALITIPHLTNQRFVSLSIKDELKQKLNIKFLFYYCFLLDDWCLKNTTKSSFASVDMVGFRNFSIPIPPLAKQERIVTILDKFDVLVNDISIGLPAELSARQLQYEYYRGKLLTFNEYAH